MKAGTILGVLISTAGLMPPLAMAHSDVESSMNRISFEVESDREVANDQVQAVLSITDENTDPARLADGINKTMAWALQLAKTSDRLTVESGSYQTHPVYDKTRIKRWRATQQLILRAKAVKELSDMVGQLQSRLQLNSIHFSVSDKTRRVVQDDLIQEALQRFQARADLIRSSLGAKAWENVQISVNTGSGYPAPRRFDAKVSSMRMAEASAPALESGTSKVTVRISGTIELKP